MVVVLRRPGQELDRRGIEHRPRIEDLEDGLQPLLRDFGRVRGREHEADEALAAEGDPHTRSDGGQGTRPRLGRRKVVEQPPEGRVERHPKDLRHGSSGIS